MYSVSSALHMVMIQNMYNVTIVIQNTNSLNLYYSSVLHYHGESYNADITIYFWNCKINGNIGSNSLSLFNVTVYSSVDVNVNIYGKHGTVINFHKCEFFNNSNFHSTINLFISTLSQGAYINILHSHFSLNRVTFVFVTTNGSVDYV